MMIIMTLITVEIGLFCLFDCAAKTTKYPIDKKPRMNLMVAYILKGQTIMLDRFG